MLRLFNFILILIAINRNVLCEKLFCDETNPLDTIFTMDSVTYARKESEQMVYRTHIGEPLNDVDSIYFENIFPTNNDEIKFANIQTGFMITDIPVCDQSMWSCKEVTKLQGLAFVIGTDKSDHTQQVYKTYRFQNITGGHMPSLDPVRDKNQMPYQTRTEGRISAGFWPKNGTDNVRYVHSTYDERTFTISHIIWNNTGTFLFSYNLQQMKDMPEFVDQTIDSQFSNETFKIKGFFQLRPDSDNSTANKRVVHAIGRSVDTGSEIVIDLEEDLTLVQSSSIVLNDIYGCRQLEAIGSTSADLIPGPTTGSITSTTSPQGSSSTIWITILIVALIVISVVVLVILCNRRKNSDQYTDDYQETGSPTDTNNSQEQTPKIESGAQST